MDLKLPAYSSYGGVDHQRGVSGASDVPGRQIAERLQKQNVTSASKKDQQSELLPKDKHDDETIKRLRKLPIQELVPLLPELLEWVADVNWPDCPQCH